MKKYSFLAHIGLMSLLLSSCIKEDVKTYQGGTVVEIDQAVLNPVAAGATYPILTRIPVEARPASTTADSTLRRLNNTTVRIRVNLVGRQSPKDETVGFTIFNTSPVATLAFGATLTAAQAPPTGQTPSAAAATLAVAGAVAGTHYSFTSNMITIPANSSFGYLTLTILNSGATAGQGRFLGIELNDLGTVKPNPNYKTVGLLIDQR